jgi:hypothetical protein
LKKKVWKSIRGCEDERGEQDLCDRVDGKTRNARQISVEKPHRKRSFRRRPRREENSIKIEGDNMVE